MKTVNQKQTFAIALIVNLLIILFATTVNAQTITTGVINGSPFCPGSSVLVPFTTTGIFPTSTVFKAQLSNSSGSFATGVSTIGSTSTGNLINGIIPSSAAAGTFYRIRVISGTPAVTGSANLTDLTIIAAANCGTNWTTTGNGNINTGNWLGSINNSGFGFRTNNTQRAFLSSVGNFGIGTSTPAEKLEVAGNILSSGTVTALSGTYNSLNIGLVGSSFSDSSNLYLQGKLNTVLNSNPSGNVILSTPSATNVLNLYKSGNVGIGTTTPTHAKLEIAGSIGSTVAMFGSEKCGVSISSNNPEIGFNSYYNGGSRTIKAGYGANIGMHQGTGDIYIGNFSNNVSSEAFGSINGYQEVITIKQNGNVGIGVTNPVNKLEVCGTIRSKELKIETGWCDYVFDKNYKLRSIPDLERYINENKHLPGIAPASEVENNGLSVGEMNKAMMEKIEELTLYIIQLKKENEELNKKVDAILEKNK